LGHRRVENEYPRQVLAVANQGFNQRTQSLGDPKQRIKTKLAIREPEGHTCEAK